MGIGVLGPLVCDRRIIGRRDRAVLSALTLYAGRPLTADQLMQAVWGDMPPPSSRKALQGCIVRLRRVLGPDSIETSDLGYRLVVPLDEVDAQRFERMGARGHELLALGEPERAASLVTQAMKLWRGTAYEDVMSWDPAMIESARLDELRLEVEELGVDASLRAGRHLEVLAAAEGMVRSAPLRERRWTLLARAQYQAGNQSDALRTIRRVKSLLAEQLGLDPSRELASLEESILRQDDSLRVGSPLAASSTCPYRGLMPYDVDDAESFFGREPDLVACLDLLRRVGSLTVVGPSGCGKSSLVRAGVAASLRNAGRSVFVITPGEHPMRALNAVAGAAPPECVLIVDQLEEAFYVRQDAEERREFLAALARWSTGPGSVVLAMRADHLAACTCSVE
jgi:DNA-binding SARP family transcriptional activator